MLRTRILSAAVPAAGASFFRYERTASGAGAGDRSEFVSGKVA